MNGFEQKLLESPSLPRLSAQSRLLLELLAADEFDATAEVLEQEPELAAQVLGLLNAKGSGAGELHSPAEAHHLVGPRTLTCSALSVSLVNGLRDSLGPSDMLDSLWRCALMTGLAARSLAFEASSWDPGEALLAGVAEKFGALLLFDQLAAYPRLAARYLAGEDDLVTLERASLDSDHGRFGALVAEHWGLPTTVIDALRAHFAIGRGATREPATSHGRILTAAALYGRALTLEGCSNEVQGLERRVGDLLRVPSSLASRIATDLAWQLSRIGPLLGLDCDVQRPYEELLADAGELLSDADPSALGDPGAPKLPRIAAPAPSRRNRSRSSAAREFEELLREGESSLPVDPRTGRFDLAGFERILSAFFDRARRLNRPLSLLVIGIDDLTEIVARLGNDAATDLRDILCERVASLVRATDAKGHLTGSHLGILAADCSERDLPGLAERICAAIGREPLPTRNGPVQCNISIGMSSVTPSAFGDPQSLLSSAWGALDAAALDGGPIAVGA